MDSSLRFTDVLYFLGELAVYVSVAWWGFTRDVPVVMRLLLGVGGIAVFVTLWAVFAAPNASMPLHGAADIALRVAWFGLGATALAVILVG